MILNYAKAKTEQKQNDTAYRAYVTDSLKNITEILAKFGGHNAEIPRFSDAIRQKNKPQKKQTAKEIISKFKRKIGISGGEKE